MSYTHKRRGSAAMRFRALIVESSKIDRSIDKSANREDIIAKFVFTLVYGFAAKFGRNIDYHVFIDSPDGSEGLNVPTQCSLNNKCKSQLGYENQPFRSVRYVRSEKSRLIQATDLLAGVVAYECNGQPKSRLWRLNMSNRNCLQNSKLPRSALRNLRIGSARRSATGSKNSGVAPSREN